MKSVRPWIFLGLVCGISATGLLAQPSPRRGDTPVPPPIKRQARVWFWGKLYTREETPQGTISTGKGNVILRFTRDEMPQGFLSTGKDSVPLQGDDSRLTTDLATYNEKTQIASSPGKLKLEDSDDTLTGNTGTAYYRTRDARIRGDVVIVSRPRPEDKNAAPGAPQKQFDSPVTLTCQKVDYNWRTRIALASEQLTVKQKDRTVTADHATYDGKKEMVILEGNVVYTTPKGENGKADKVTIYYTKGKEKFVADNTSFVHPVDDAEVDGETNPSAGGTNENSTKPAPGGTPPAPAPGPPPAKPENKP